jgi:hypothetical protein
VVDSPVGPHMERTANSYFNLNFDGAAGLEALSTAATSSLPYIRPLPVPEQPSPHSLNNINFILNPTGPDSSISEFQIWKHLPHTHR